MGYSYNRFLKPLSESDKTIKIYDDRNYPVYTVNPFSVLTTYINGNNLVISLSGNKIIILDFISASEAQNSLIKLQTYIDQLKAAAESIPDEVTYLDPALINSAGIKSFNGSTASVHRMVLVDDSNIELGMSLTQNVITEQGGSASSTEAMHTLSVNWTGILPMERGGLNNTLFSASEILISTGNSVVSSGHLFDDYGHTTKEIWSAGKIISYISETFINKEVPFGDTDGSNQTFYLLFDPVVGSEHLYMNGLLQDSEEGMDYTIFGNTITFNEAPPIGSKLKCSYMPKRGFQK